MCLGNVFLNTLGGRCHASMTHAVGHHRVRREKYSRVIHFLSAKAEVVLRVGASS